MAAFVVSFLLWVLLWPAVMFPVSDSGVVVRGFQKPGESPSIISPYLWVGHLSTFSFHHSIFVTSIPSPLVSYRPLFFHCYHQFYIFSSIPATHHSGLSLALQQIGNNSIFFTGNELSSWNWNVGLMSSLIILSKPIYCNISFSWRFLLLLTNCNILLQIIELLFEFGHFDSII